MSEPEIVKITDLEELTEVDPANDFLVVVDSSEPIDANKTKKIKPENLTVDIESIINAVYPVGSIYTSVININPATLFGVGEWASFGAGRVLVGVDTEQAEFDTVKETGGAKTHTLTIDEMPSHTHIQNAHNHSLPFRELWRWQAWTSGSSEYGYAYNGSNFNTGNRVATNQNTGGGAAHNNLQPYITVYFWERTA